MQADIALTSSFRDPSFESPAAARAVRQRPHRADVAQDPRAVGEEGRPLHGAPLAGRADGGRGAGWRSNLAGSSVHLPEPAIVRFMCTLVELELGQFVEVHVALVSELAQVSCLVCLLVCRCGVLMRHRTLAARLAVCPVPVVDGQPEVSAALAAVWRRLCSWRAAVGGDNYPAPPEPRPRACLPAS